MKGICLAFLMVIVTTHVLPEVVSKSTQFATALILLIYVTMEVYQFISMHRSLK